MLVESLKQIVSNFVTLGLHWHFEYGKEHWLNLGDYPEDGTLPFADRQKYLQLLWKDKDLTLNKHGGIEGYTYVGEMVLLVRSKLSDPDYDYKYETHIKNLETEALLLFNNILDCDGWTVKAWKEIEVENEYDTNMDGLKIRFTMEYET